MSCHPSIPPSPHTHPSRAPSQELIVTQRQTSGTHFPLPEKPFLWGIHLEGFWEEQGGWLDGGGGDVLMGVGAW